MIATNRPPGPSGISTLGQTHLPSRPAIPGFPGWGPRILPG